MKKYPIISVIVPVYNVEKYLRKCIESILDQTYTNLEIILVDDGSPDNCGRICDEYAGRDSRVIVIHKENGGQSSARNAGLDIAEGEYIAFLDSDDYMDTECLSKLYSYMTENNLEISACNYARYSESYDFINLNEKRNNDIIIDGTEAQRRIWYAKGISIAPWGKLYRRTLWNDVRFKECRFYEDYATMHLVYTKVHRFGYMHEPLINYVVRANSDVRSFNELKLLTLDIADDTVAFAEKNYPQLLQAALAKKVSTYFHIYIQLNNDSHPISERIKAQIKKYRMKVLADNEARIKVRAACLLSFFGFRTVKSVFRLMKNKK